MIGIPTSQAMSRFVEACSVVDVFSSETVAFLSSIGQQLIINAYSGVVKCEAALDDPATHNSCVAPSRVAEYHNSESFHFSDDFPRSRRKTKTTTLPNFEKQVMSVPNPVSFAKRG